MYINNQINGTLLRPKTKKAQAFINNYKRIEQLNNVENTSVLRWYKNPSYNKIRAEALIEEKMRECDGWGYLVLGDNSQTFTAGWLIKCKKSNLIYLVYETYCNRYLIPYDYE